MVCKRIVGTVFILILSNFISAAPINLTVNSGKVLLKNPTATEWESIDAYVQIETGDSLTIGDAVDVECTLLESIKLFLKDSCTLVINHNEKKVSLTLLKGQVFLKKGEVVEGIAVEIRAKNCIFTPVGTAAAVKITKKGDPSVAVLQGKIRMTKPDGAAMDVGAGNYCTFNVAANSFSPLKELPPNAVAALESWSGTKLGQDETKPQPDTEEVSEDVAETLEKMETEVPAEEETKQEPVKEPEPKEEKKVVAEPAKPVTPSEPAKEEEKPAEEVTEKEEKKPEKEEQKKEEGPAKPVWELSAAMVTVDDEQWTRIALAVDVPIWRFGICFDLELFLDGQGNFTNKGWDFSSGKNVAESLLRKIRYIRFNHSGDPIYIKVGGLDNVTFCYGFIVDRFTNMLNYPGEKLFGIEFELNDLGPVGITLQTLLPDVKDFGNDGGIVAGRLAFKPFKMTEKPIIGGLSIGGTIASDLNQYAPARMWDYKLHGTKWDRDEDNITDSTYLFDTYADESYYQSLIQDHKNNGDYDADVAHKDEWAKDEEDRIIIVGGDIVVPIVSSKLLNLDLYGQSGVTLDEDDDDKIYKGWGIGAPGVGVKAGPLWARVEYRHIRDKFAPGYFNTYYLLDRIRRNPEVYVKEDSLPPVKLNGVFGMCGVNIKNFVIVSGAYQRLVGEDDILDQRAEGQVSLGDVVLERIPKVNKVEVFYYQTDIDKKKDKPFFFQSPTTYWGYRLGCEVIAGAFIVWETRYGWVWNEDRTELIDDKAVTIKAGIAF